MDNSLTEGVVEAMGRLSINDTGDGSQFRCVSGMYPGRPGEPDCKYFLRMGTCAYGRNCRFNHPSAALYDHGIAYTLEFPERVGEPDCGYYLKTGTCKYGAACKFNHPKDKQTDVWMNILGLPMRQDARPCPFYMRMGVCRYGHACKFHHPQPSSAPFYFPVLGHPAPLSSTSTYLTGSSSTLQQWQSYSPAFIYPSQDWSMYMGNVWPSSASHIVAAPPSDDISAYDLLPQQPYRPECRYFVNHGSCRYGSNCRYHHPILSNPIALPDHTPDPGCESESSSMPDSDPPQASKPDSNGTTTDNNDEALKVSSTLGVSPNRTDSFPHSSVASNQIDSE